MEKFKFKKKYVDYTIYVWNKKTLSYLKDNGIQEFTTSPELSYEINKNIFENISRLATKRGNIGVRIIIQEKRGDLHDS